MKKPAVIHPFCFAVFPILALFVYNARTISIPIGEMALPSGLSLAGTLVLFFSFRFLIRNGDKAGVLVSLFLFWFFSFGHVMGILNPWTALILGETILYGTMIMIAIGFLLVIRSRKNFAGLTRLLNIVSLALIAINLISGVQVLTLGRNSQFKRNINIPTKTGPSPNVYFIVLDGYARADVLSELYEYDNTPFVRYLEQKGFYVASRSYSNYCQTYLSLAATLNLSYLNEIADQWGSQSNDRRPLVQMIRHSRVIQLLKSQGYSLISFESGYSGTGIRDSDFYFHFTRSPSEFQNVLINTTPLPLLVKLLPHISPYTIHRNRILGAFRRLSNFSFKKTPFFILAHIMAPHPPFVFGEGGEEVDPPGFYLIRDGSYLHGTEEVSIQSYIRSYRDQLSVVNEMIKITIDGILATSPAPIIILQSDHGPRALTDMENPTATYNKEVMAILNAVYLPGGDYHDFYPDISPINSFIILMNRILGTNMNLLEDKSYFSTWGHPYDFFPLDKSSFDQTTQSIREIQKNSRRPE